MNAMNNQPQADTPLLAGADPTPGPAGIHTPEGQLAVLREWANQYQGGSFPETVAAKVCSLLIATEPLDLAAVQADPFHTQEITTMKHPRIYVQPATGSCFEPATPSAQSQQQIELADVVVPEVSSCPLRVDSMMDHGKLMKVVGRLRDDLTGLLNAARTGTELQPELFVPDLWFDVEVMHKKKKKVWDAMRELWHLGHDLASRLGYERSGERVSLKDWSLGGSVYVLDRQPTLVRGDDRLKVG